MAERAERRTMSLAGKAGVVLFLAAVWVMLWGSASALTVLGGLAAGTLLTFVFPQPPAPLGIGGRGGRIAVALGHVALDIARSTLAVAWAAVRTGPATRSAVVRIRVPVCRSEVLVLASSLMSISPGSVAVEIDVERSELLVHVLPVTDPERTRAELEEHTARLVRAFRRRADR